MKCKCYIGGIREGTNIYNIVYVVEWRPENLHREGENWVRSWGIYVVLLRGRAFRKYNRQMLGDKYIRLGI